ncbi:hypothetical protein BDR04DRAFT_1157361 [Suillus decipiens]|nr:hypothetical protein BDR04DRAFT_1157361 [Suillus decipiens]
MPICTVTSAPYFDSNARRLYTFLQEVDQLLDKAGISQESQIKYAVRYADPDEADLWKDLDEYTGSSYEDFANAILQFYPECGPMHYVSARPSGPKSSDICELIIQDEPVASNAEEVLDNIPSTDSIECTIIQDNPIVADVAAIPEILDPIGDELAKAEMLQVTSDIVEDDILTPQNILHSPETVEIDKHKISALGCPVTPDHFALFMIFTVLLTSYTLMPRFLPAEHAQSNPKLPRCHLKISALISHFRGQMSEIHKHGYQFPVYGSYPYHRPSHSLIAFTLYEIHRCLQVKKKL